MTRISLKEPYWGAGSKFPWRRYTDDMCGFGVDLKLLEGEGDLEISVGDGGKWGIYTISKEKARQECDFWSSYMTIRHTKLGIIPRFYCSRIK